MPGPTGTRRAPALDPLGVYPPIPTLGRPSQEPMLDEPSETPAEEIQMPLPEKRAGPFTA